MLPFVFADREHLVMRKVELWNSTIGRRQMTQYLIFFSPYWHKYLCKYLLPSLYVRGIYTVVHKKCATLFWTITPAFIDGFQRFVHQLKQEEIFYWGITKFATLPQLSLHYLRKCKNTQNSTFWNQLSVYFNAKRRQRQEQVQVNCFRVCAQNVHPLLAHRLPNDLSTGR